MTRLNLQHVSAMMRANDVPGLQAAAEGPLRSYTTGLKIGVQLLNKYDEDKFAPAVTAALNAVKTFYQKHPDVIALGDERAYSLKHPRTPEEISALVSAIRDGSQLMDDLKRAVFDPFSSAPAPR